MKHSWANELDRDHANAFRRLRIALGLLGFSLPLVLAGTGLVMDGHVQPSISDVFHTTQRDLLVGGLSVIGMFLMLHRGWRRWPGRWVSPDFIVFSAGLGAMGVAFFPNESAHVSTMSQAIFGLTVAPNLHYGAALILFLMMSMSCFLIYAPASTGWERRFHVWMGRVIFASGIMVLVFTTIKRMDTGWAHDLVVTHNMIFWDESIGVWAFSISWLLKAWMELRQSKALSRSRAGLQRGAARASAPTLAPGDGPFPGLGSDRSLSARLRAWLRGLPSPTPMASPMPSPAQIAAHRRHQRSLPQPAHRVTTPATRRRA